MAIAIREDEQIVFSTEPSPVRETDSIVSPMTPDAVELPANDEHFDTQQVRTKIAELDGHRVSIGSESKFKHTSTSSESAITGSEASFCNEACPTSWLSLNTSPLLMTQGPNHPRARSEQLLLGGSIDERTVDREAWYNHGYMDEKQVANYGGGIGYNYDGHPRVTEAVTSAMQHLHHVRHQEQISRPIRVESQNQLHRPPPEILKLFETSVRYEMQIRRLIAKDWLRVATWWLLKVRISHGHEYATLTIHERRAQLSQTATDTYSLAPGAV